MWLILPVAPLVKRHRASVSFYTSVIVYYCFEVDHGRLLAKGDLSDSNEGLESSLGRVDFGMQLGGRLSASVESICLGELELAAREAME